jgi:outer membrane biosynthesis protein TonB
MKPGLIISCLAHAAALLWGLIAFAAKPNDAPVVEPLPVEFVSATDFSQLTAGVKNAPKPLEQPKPLADKVGESNPAKQLAAKVADKPDIVTDSAPPLEPKSEPKPEPKPQAKAEPKPEPKPVDKPEAKPEPKAADKAEKPKPPEPKPDQIADELKKEEAKKPPKPQRKEPQFKPDQIAEQLKRDENKKPPVRFDANQVATLLDKRDPQRRLATAETLNGAVSLGAPEGHATQLSQSWKDALIAALSKCWTPPAGFDPDSNLYVRLDVKLKLDGSLMQRMVVIEDTAAAALGPALAESAKRAVMLCQPFTMLKRENYDEWKDLDLKFDSKLLGG